MARSPAATQACWQAHLYRAPDARRASAAAPHAPAAGVDVAVGASRLAGVGPPRAMGSEALCEHAPNVKKSGTPWEQHPTWAGMWEP